MDINCTLLGEIITFGVLVFITLKYIWPPLTRAMEERQQKIADGITAAEHGQHDLENARNKAKEILGEARAQAKAIKEQIDQEAVGIIDRAKTIAQEENAKSISTAKSHIDQEKIKALQEVKQHLGNLVVEATKKVLGQVDENIDRKLVDEFINELKT